MSDALMNMRDNANLGSGASIDIGNSVAAYNSLVVTYNDANPTLHQIPRVGSLGDIDKQSAGMIVAAQAEANTLSTTVDTLADVYTMLQSEFGGG